MPRATFQEKQLWRAPTTTWLKVLSNLAPDSRWAQAGDQSISGCCPFHTENEPSFRVYPDRGFAKCYGGSCNYFTSNPLKFLAELAPMPQDQALGAIVAKQFSLKITGAITKEVRAAAASASLRSDLASTFNKVLVEAIAKPGRKEYDYIQPLVEWLVVRKIPLDLVPRLPIGVLPTKAHIFNLLEEEHKISFEKYLGEKLLNIDPHYIGHFTGGLSFHYNTSPGSTGRIKIRRVGEKNFFWAGDGDEEEGIFGLDMFASQLGQNHTVYVVEGEFDALAPYCEQVKSGGIPANSFLAVSGSMVKNLDVLAEYGYASTVILPDNDAGGVGFARLALQKSTSSTVRVFDWTRSLMQETDGADVDSLCSSGRYPELEAALVNPDTRQNRVDWIFGQLQTELSLVDKGDINEQKATLAPYAECLHNDVERTHLGDMLSKADLVEAALVRLTLNNADTQEEYVDTICRTLPHAITPLHSSGFDITFYSHTSRRTYTYNRTRSRDALATVSAALGKPIYKWCEDNIGSPAWLMLEPAGRGEVKRRELLARADILDKLFLLALEHLTTNLPPEETLTVKRQGTHYIDAQAQNWSVATTPGTRHRLYVVNGSDAFVGYLDFENRTTRYEQLEVPVQGQLHFQLAQQKWSHEITLATLSAKSEYDRKEIVLRSIDVVQTGWCFSDIADFHRLDSMYLGAMPFYYTIASAFEFMTQNFLHADPQSGKSALLSLFCAEDGQSKISLCENSSLWSEYTAAGVVQGHRGRGSLLCLDEFENPKDRDHDAKRRRAVRELLTMFRQNNVTDVKSVRGTATGGTRTQTFRAPVLAAGVNTFDQSDTNVDLSRWNITRGIHIPDRNTAPETLVINKYSEEILREQRRATTLLPLQEAASLVAHYRAVVERYSSPGAVPENTDFRLLNNILPAVGVLSWAGLDYDTFLCEYLGYKLVQRDRYYGKPTHSVLDDLLTVSQVKLPDEPERPCTVSSLLADKQRRPMLNTLLVGVYFDADTETVIISCRQALHQLLRYHRAYFDVDAVDLRTELLSHPDALQVSAMKKINATQIVRTATGARNVRYTDLAAFPLSAITGGRDTLGPDDIETDE